MIIKYLFLLFLLVACQSAKKKKELEVVNIGLYHGEAVEISEFETQNEYGPSLPGGEKFSTEIQKNDQKVVGLFLRDGLYLSHGYISLYRYLASQKIKPSIQACLGYSCVIAALYAKYGNASQVEWKAFALWKKIKEEKTYSSKWKEILFDFFEEEFLDTRIEKMRGITVFYLWNSEKNKLFSLSRGDVVWALKHSVVLDRSEKWQNTLASTYLASSEDLKSFGADIVIDTTITPSKSLLSQNDGYLIGMFGRALSLQKRIEPSINFNYDLPLDERKNFSSIITHATKELKRNSQSLDELMTQIFPIN